jgi:hypothetical protein
LHETFWNAIAAIPKLISHAIILEFISQHCNVGSDDLDSSWMMDMVI